MEVTTTLTGMLPAGILVSAFLTAIISAVLLWMYRRATLRAMGQATTGALPRQKPHATAKLTAGSLSPLTIQSRPGTSTEQVVAGAATRYQNTARSLRSLSVVYAAAGFVYAMIFTAAWIIRLGDGFLPGRFLWLLACHLWPIVLTIGLVSATLRRERVIHAGVYFAALALLVAYLLARNPESSVYNYVYFWLFANAPATALQAAFLRRRIRAVGPMVFGFLVFGVTGTFISIEASGNSDRLLQLVTDVGQITGLGAFPLFLLMNVVVFGIFAVPGWWLLRRIGHRYRAKRASDQSITMDSLWLMFGVVQSITLVFDGWVWIFTGLVAFAGYKLVTLSGFALLRRRARKNVGASTLLLLRVFALGRRSEQFFDAFSTWWRHSGSISLIAGPDLATTAVEPHEFLDFLSGKLSRHFVQGQADLDLRLADLDKLPDPDGRFRVNEFYCHADTWQMTMRGLAKESDAALMDLRSFSPANQGCLYELEQLLDRVDLGRVVFLVDETTDRPFLEESLQQLWQGVDPASPNCRSASPTARLFDAKDRSKKSMKALHLMLLGTSTAT